MIGIFENFGMSDSDNFLNCPHSRFVPSTEYYNHYTDLYESEVVLKKDEFNNFFRQFALLKDTNDQYNELKRIMEEANNKMTESDKIYNNFISTDNFNKQLIESSQNRGKAIELRENLVHIFKFTKKAIKEINENPPPIKKFEIGQLNKEKLEKIKSINETLEKINNKNYIDEISNIESDQSVLYENLKRQNELEKRRKELERQLRLNSRKFQLDNEFDATD
ncbi:hypothetical protein TRFO_35094 [Tritrichomonas foetus]|uniref:Uncharacterized protein n=1 Tax=Tritrichomonas foetus TaxID=1144522 RepID=A0A1J4JLP9_9EUKA|nr:hypothetical protein TRFO_35094 [Tritrichomonas foetus]|eukprot:OHS98469.1 hypothetical protein TRFO_35094 [Tritrichomonas foetus]